MTPTRYTLSLNNLTLAQVDEIQGVLQHTSLASGTEPETLAAEAATPTAEPKKVKKEKAAPTAAPAAAPATVSAYPLGGPIVKPITFDELKRRAMLFMDDPMCGGELFATRLAEFNRLDGSPVKRLSDVPAEIYDTFIGRLVPDAQAAAPATSGSLLD